MAVPFYTRPRNSTYSDLEENKNKNITTNQAKKTKKMMSTVTDHFSNKPLITAGQREKPLEIYQPNSLRSRLPVEDFK